MLNNYTYDINKITPNVVSVSSSQLESMKRTYSEILPDDGARKISNSNKLSVHDITMGLDSYFKLTIEGLMIDKNMKMDNKGGKGSFLPVESITFAPISVESQRLNIGIFSDLPILSKRRMGSLQVVLLDNQTATYEYTVNKWFRDAVNNPDNPGYVSTISEIVRKVDYYEYTPTGIQAKHYQFCVIPDGEVSSNRSYTDNKLKTVTFNMLIIGNVIELQTGESFNGNSKESSSQIVPTGAETKTQKVYTVTYKGRNVGTYYSEKEANDAIETDIKDTTPTTINLGTSLTNLRKDYTIYVQSEQVNR